jgi:hypothetical protein
MKTYLRFAMAAVITLCLSACSTVETSGGGLQLASALSSEKVQLKVRTGDPRMDAIVYEMAYEQFSKVMPLREQGPYTAALEVTFASTGQSAFLGSSTTAVNGSAATSGWYTGGSAVATTVSSGTFLEWQNSTMLAVLRHNDGERLWSADYSYKGGWEMSGWVVNTPEEAARLVSKRLATRFSQDVGTPKHP